MRYCFPLRWKKPIAFYPVRCFFFFVVLILSKFSFTHAQNAYLNSLAFIRVNEDNEDAFSFLILRDLPSGEQVYITDEGWNGNSWVGNSEDHLVYTSPGLSAGEVVHVEEAPSGSSFIVGGAGGSLIYASGSSGFSLSSGDQLLAYTSDEGPEPDHPVFLSGIHLDDGKDIAGGINPATGWSNQDYLDSGGTSVHASAVPSGLTNGVNCVALFPDPDTEKDNAIYDCTKGTKGTRKQLLQKICNRANWLGQNSPRYPENQVCNFIVLGSPEIQVLGNGNEIVNGDMNPGLEDFTDFGGFELGAGSIIHSFSIKNRGDTLLEISSITLSDAINFSIKSPVPQSLLPGSVASFEIEFNPGAEGTFSSHITISCNDEENGNFLFQVSGSCVDVQPPSLQVRMLEVVCSHATSANLRWGRGNGKAVAVFIAHGNTPAEIPVNNTSYSADTLFGSGAQIGISGWYCLYNGTGDSLTVCDLFPGTTYSIAAFEYNEESGLIKYNRAITGSNKINFPTTSVLINEVDADTPGSDEMEFIELYDGGVGSTKLDGLTLIAFNGSNDESYFSFSLDGYQTDQSGYFVIGNPGLQEAHAIMAISTLQNGADAIALFASDITKFPNGTLLTENSLVDALVYDTNDSDDPGLLNLLNPGEPQVNEDEIDKDLYSMQRIPNGSGGTRNTTTYLTTYSTPGYENKVASEIAVFGNGIQIANEDSVPDASNFTDFGNAEVNFQTVSKIFKIVNQGEGILNIGSSPGIQVSGTHTANFVVTQTPPSEVAPGDSAFFEISFSPQQTGLNLADITIRSDDPENPVFAFSVQGEGIFSVNLLKEDIQCNGENSGKIIAATASGSGNFIFEWSTGRVVHNIVSDTLSNLLCGIYFVKVTDQFLNEFTDTIEIAEPPELLAVISKKRNLDCVGDDSGKLTVCASGGVPPYSIFWSDGQQTVTAKNLREGAYSSIITDANGCETTLSDSIIVTDSIKPVAICKDTTIFLDRDGNVRIHTRDISALSWDNCEIGMRGLNHSLFDCNDIGINEVIATVGDHNGNISHCSSFVTINDTIPPQFICSDLIAYADSSGWINISSRKFLNGLYDNCGVSNIEPDSFHIEFASLDMETKPWINEFHYDNAGADENEFVEIAGEAGTQLDGYEIVLYNGSDGTSYRNIPLTGTVPDEIAGFGVLAFFSSGIQNGPADGIALISPESEVIEFISYEGQLTALDDFAEGLFSTDVDCHENSNSSANSSIQKITTSAWIISEESSPGSLNPGQSLPEPGTLNLDVSVTDINGNNTVCKPKLTLMDTIAPVALCHDTTLFLGPDGQAQLSAEAMNAGSSDNCGIISQIELSKTLFSCEDAGVNRISFFVSDLSGNISTCESEVFVRDTTLPVALCADTTLYLDNNGEVGISAEMIDSGSYDNCAVADISINKNLFGCENAGENIVSLYVTDYAENIATCQSIVIIEDTIPPIARCNDLKLYLDKGGSAVLSPQMLDAGFSDNCEIASIGISQQSFDCTKLGFNTIKLNVSDLTGNLAECYSTIEVLDTLSPEAICMDTMIFLDDNGTASIFPELIDGGSFDNCFVSGLLLDKSQFSCADIGLNNVVMNVSDGQGNISGCVSFVRVVDSTPPVVLCHDTILFLDQQGKGSVSGEMLNAGSFDNCGLGNLSLDVSEFSCADMGENSVHLTAFDLSGNSAVCQSVVTVLDTIPPEIVCLDTILYIDKNGKAGASSRDIIKSAYDNCENFSVYTDSLLFGCNSLVEPTVTATGKLPEIVAIDLSGNVSTCHPKIELLDTISPEALCRNFKMSLDQNGLAEIASEMIDAGSSDNCMVANLELSQELFTCENLGVNSTSLKVTDWSGNVSTCTSDILVTDSLPPVARSRDTLLSLDEEGFACLKAQWLDNGSIDNCAIASFSLSQDTFTCLDIGIHEIVFSVTDSSGNQDSCISRIIIEDNIAPVFTPVNDIVVDASAGTCFAQIEYPTIVAEDNCMTEITQLSGLGQGKLFPEGVTNEVYRVKDIAGNQDTMSFRVTVNHTNAPPAMAEIPDFEIAEDSTLSFYVEGITDGDSCVEQDLDFSIQCISLFIEAEILADYQSRDSVAHIKIGFMPDWYGESQFQVSVADCEDATIKQSFLVNVSPVNDPPVLLSSFPDFEIQAAQTLCIPVSREPGVVFADVDDDALSYKFLINGDTTFPDFMNYTNDTLFITPAISDTGLVKVILSAKDLSGATAADTFMIKILGYKTGIKQQEIDAIRIYPNPTNGLIYIEINNHILEKNPEIIIYTEEGNTIIRRKIDGLTTQFRLNGFSDGAYYLRIKTEENVFVRKIIFNRHKVYGPE